MLGIRQSLLEETLRVLFVVRWTVYPAPWTSPRHGQYHFDRAEATSRFVYDNISSLRMIARLASHSHYLRLLDCRHFRKASHSLAQMETWPRLFFMHSVCQQQTAFRV